MNQNETKTVLLVGGAGYIGSHTARALAAQNYRVVVYDNLSRGHRWAVKWGSLVEGDIFDTARLRQVLLCENVEAVFHFAASSLVGQSMEKPLDYWKNNVGGTISLLQAMKEAGTGILVFSSSAAVFGEPDFVPITEEHPARPNNTYGKTKLTIESMLEDCHRAFGLSYASLRYFNAAGASPDAEIGEDHEPETHLIPLVLDAALGLRDQISIYGDDYDTPDGTCIRDYIHVCDLADAHVVACERLKSGVPNITLNLGNGVGYSVREVIETARRITGCEIKVVGAPRRAGDPARLVAASDKAKESLGWKPGYGSLDTIIETAWRWHRRRFSPDSPGYENSANGGDTPGGGDSPRGAERENRP